jgi:hypothetical protein
MKNALKFLSLVAILGSSLYGASASATQIGIEGAASLPESNTFGQNSPSILAGGELTFGPSVASIGLFYDHNFLSFPGGGTGGQNFYGVVGRIQIPLTPIFFDAKVGAENYTFSGGGSTTTDFGAGGGVGLRFSLGPAVDLCPHVQYRYLPEDNSVTTYSSATLDFGLLLQFLF